jgi:hypothetical protein
MPKPKLIWSPEFMWTLFVQYKEHCKSNPFRVQDFVGKDGDQVYREKERCMTMEGFENFVADQPEMPLELDHYFANRDNRYTEYVSICTRIRKAIRQDQIEGGMAGIYNASITQRLNNLVEKSETNVKVEQEIFKSLELDVHQDNGTGEDSKA